VDPSEIRDQLQDSLDEMVALAAKIDGEEKLGKEGGVKQD